MAPVSFFVPVLLMVKLMVKFLTAGNWLMDVNELRSSIV